MKNVITKFTEFLTEHVQCDINFEKWFNGSKVVDNNNEPLVVYHGSNSNFKIFNISKSQGTHNETDQVEGIYFTDDWEGAAYFALADDSRFIKSVYLSIKNPYYSFNYKELKERLGIDKLSDVKNKLEEMGYDGLIVEHGFYARGLYKLYLAFKPNQVKSVDNDGSFDVNDDNIYS